MEKLDKEVYIKCDCGTHLFYIGKEVEKIEGHKDIALYYVALFTYGQFTSKNGFWHRLKNAFRYLKDGTFHKDQLVLTPDEANKLRDFLIDSTNNK
jgi:hypothetical protein